MYLPYRNQWFPNSSLHGHHQFFIYVLYLYNEFGWEAIDDRAYHWYGGTVDGEPYGPGKKIDPSHYITPEWTNINRKAYVILYIQCKY